MEPPLFSVDGDSWHPSLSKPSSCYCVSRYRLEQVWPKLLSWTDVLLSTSPTTRRKSRFQVSLWGRGGLTRLSLRWDCSQGSHGPNCTTPFPVKSPLSNILLILSFLCNLGEIIFWCLQPKTPVMKIFIPPFSFSPAPSSTCHQNIKQPKCSEEMHSSRFFL